MAEERARKADLDRALNCLKRLRYRVWNGTDSGTVQILERYRSWNGTDPERLEAGKLAHLERDKAVETKLRKKFRKLADGFE